MPFPVDFISDHAYQSRKFSAIDADSKQLISSLNVGTWNTQDKGYPKAKHVTQAFSNNPYDTDESIEEYEVRKNKQIDKIIANLHNGDDILFLQEIDFLTSFKGVGDELTSAKQRLSARLIQLLHQINYAIELSPPYKQQRLATIYNSDKLTLQPNSSIGVFNSPTSGKFRGFEIAFEINGSPLIATNLHLEYGHDYRKEIEDYQITMQKRGVFHVMGGDTNNIQTQYLSTALGDWHQATNFSGHDDPNTKQRKLTTYHENDPQKQKAYDRFFVVSPKGCYVQTEINNTRNEMVTIDAEGNPKFALTPQGQPSRTRVGERWRRGKDIMIELWEELQAYPPESPQAQACIERMRSDSAWKGLQYEKMKASSEWKDYPGILEILKPETIGAPIPGEISLGSAKSVDKLPPKGPHSAKALQNKQPSLQPTAVGSPKNLTAEYPDSYSKLFTKPKSNQLSPDECFIKQARELLHDYSKKAQGWWWFIHPLRHYASQVEQLVKEIDKGTKVGKIKTSKALLQGLEKIEKESSSLNKHGSFACRSSFIKEQAEKLNSDQKPKHNK